MSADGCAGRPSVTGCLWTCVVIFPLGTALKSVHLTGSFHGACKVGDVLFWVFLWSFICLFLGGDNLFMFLLFTNEAVFERP